MSGSTAVMEPISAGKLVTYVRFLIGSFKASEAEDGEVLTRALTALLGGYPEFAVRAVCDPRTGLPVKSERIPSLYVIRSACEAQIAPLMAAEAQRRRAEANDADKPAPVSDADSARRKAFIADWRLRLAAERSVDDGGEVKLHEMDARRCQGEMRGMVAKAITAKLEQLTAECAAQPLRLSDAALATAAGHAPQRQAAEG